MIITQKQRTRLARRVQDNYKRLNDPVQGRYTVDEFLALCNVKGWVCSYCGRSVAPGDVSMDHLVPISRGGTNFISNIVPCCLSCNLSKGNRSVTEWRDGE